MKLDKAIIIKNLSKKYKLYSNTKERLIDLISTKSYGEDFYALRNINFEADHGEVVGFVGINGSGKSTLSNIISGIVPETSGTVEVNGQVSLIAVAAGLKNDLTGRDNIELKLLMLGFDKKEIIALEDDIIEFSELGQFIDQPVKSYSSGMKSRLGFAISVNIDPDILVIDEALSVGDKAFAEKCLDKMKEFKESGKTMIFVSHSVGQMEKFCDKILWLEFGKVKEYGDVEIVMPKYKRFLELWKDIPKDKRDEYRTKAINMDLNYDSYLKAFNYDKSEYKTRLISKIGKLRDGKSLVYRSPIDLSNGKSTKSLKNYSFFIKKEATINGEKFYLLSHKPSSSEGVVGWIKATNIATRNLVFIEQDPKIFTLNGKGKAYDRPWGSKKNIILDKLDLLKGIEFHVERTEKVRNRNWYCGFLENKKVWVHEKQFKEVDETENFKL